jgi:hypothetical protein
MNYISTYHRLIAKAKWRTCPDGYVERHHIMPRALGGSDDSDNLVTLTSREHFIAHMLLAKMHGGVMWQALVIMKGGNRYVNARMFEVARRVAPIEREKAIALKRQSDPVFDNYMNKVKSSATKNRQEGYQAKAGQEFKVRFANDIEYANIIRINRAKAQEKSVESVRQKSAIKAQKVLELRLDGLKYNDIKDIVKCSMGFISKVVNYAHIS